MLCGFAKHCGCRLLKENIYIGRKHVVFGKVVDGMDVLNKIEQCPTGERDRPDKPIKVLSSGEVSRGKSNGVIENGKWQNDS